jgi:hypothetical protein
LFLTCGATAARHCARLPDKGLVVAVDLHIMNFRDRNNRNSNAVILA